MRKLMHCLLFLLVCMFLFAGAQYFSSFAFAHELESNGSIEALMHVDPEDSPIAGKISDIHFIIKDENGLFKRSECDCSASIYLKNNLLYTTTQIEKFSFVFSQKGTYAVRLIGKPKDGAAFQLFAIKYKISVGDESIGYRVLRSIHTLTFFIHAILFLLGVIAVIVCVFLLFRMRSRS